MPYYACHEVVMCGTYATSRPLCALAVAVLLFGFGISLHTFINYGTAKYKSQVVTLKKMYVQQILCTRQQTSLLIVWFVNYKNLDQIVKLMKCRTISNDSLSMFLWCLWKGHSLHFSLNTGNKYTILLITLSRSDLRPLHSTHFYFYFLFYVFIC